MIVSAWRGLVGASLLCVGLAFPAAAETAEEAVAYAFMGLADGASIERATTRMDWTEASASPAVFDGRATIGGKPMSFTFTVNAVDSCHYEVMLKGEIVPGGGETLYARIDLSAVTDVSIGADTFRVDVGGDGFCETGRTNPDCMQVNRSDLFGRVDAARHAEAVAFIRDRVCPAAQ